MNNYIETALSPKADLSGDFHTLFIVDDDEDVLPMIVETVLRYHPDTVVMSTLDSALAMNALERLQFDVVICDINMPGVMGNRVIENVKRLSPATYTIAITGYLETAFLAGQCQPDAFLDKNKGFDSIVNIIGQGVREAGLRRERVLKPYSGKEGQGLHWRELGHIKSELGSTPRELLNARRKIAAIALLTNRKKITREQIALTAGYSTFQKLESALKDMTGLFDLPH